MPDGSLAADPASSESPDATVGDASETVDASGTVDASDTGDSLDLAPDAVNPTGRLARFALLAVVFVCAACGLVYELALVTLGSYLLGNTATQASIVLAVMVFAMGVGSLLAKPLRRNATVSFAVIELLLALVGGLSVLVLYLAFAFISLYTPALVVMAFLIGVLIGAEMPLLMDMLQRIRRQDASEAVADLFAADYVGALIGGLAFPFVLLPFLGQIRGAIVVGIINAVAASLIALFMFVKVLTRRARLALVGSTLVVLAVLIAAFVFADRFEATARQVLYRDPIAYSERTQYQDIVVTEAAIDGPDIRLYLNGDLQFSSTDEYRYHEALVHPAMAAHPRNVLVLGGGDGLALREIVKYDDVESVTLVELDPAMIALASNRPELRELNADAFADPRVSVVNDDAFTWLRDHSASYDAIVIDMPDPDETATAKLYSVEFYSLVRAHLTDGGVGVVQSGSPYFAPQSFWCINATLRAAGFGATPYHVDVPSFGDWGFHLISAAGPPSLALDGPPDLKFLTPDVLQAATVFPADRPPLEMPASTLDKPIILQYAQAEWSNY